jgi:hypothetical protein
MYVLYFISFCGLAYISLTHGNIDDLFIMATISSRSHQEARLAALAGKIPSAASTDAGEGEEECSILDDELIDELKKLGDLEPLERQLIRLEGLEPYVLVSVLTATASYSTINSEEFISPEGVVDWTAAGLLLSSLGSTLCGLYSTITFSLSILYGKTALGMDREDKYLYFLDQTAGKRLRGFQAFKVSLLLFGVSILLLSVDKLPEQLRPIGGLFSAACIIFGYTEWNELTEAAQPIFTNVIPKNEDGKDD